MSQPIAPALKLALLGRRSSSSRYTTGGSISSMKMLPLGAGSSGAAPEPIDFSEARSSLGTFMSSSCCIIEGGTPWVSGRKVFT